MRKIYILMVLLVASLGFASGAEAYSTCGMGDDGGGYSAPYDPTSTHQNYSFCDTFSTDASGYWGKESGSWRNTFDHKYSDSDHGGGRHGGGSSSYGDSYSSFKDYINAGHFVLDIDISNVGYGGVYLRSTGEKDGVVLVIVGAAGWYGDRYYAESGFYWHVKKDGDWGTAYVDSSTDYDGYGGGDIHLKIIADGDNYSAYVGDYGGGYANTLVTTYHNDKDYGNYNGYNEGHIALYDYTGHNYDNFCVDNPGIIPEPSTYLLLGSGLLGLVAWRRRQAKKG